MFKLLSIDPGKNKCGLVLAELSENEEAKEELSNIFPWDEKLDDYEASLDDA